MLTFVSTLGLAVCYFDVWLPLKPGSFIMSKTTGLISMAPSPSEEDSEADMISLESDKSICSEYKNFIL